MIKINKFGGKILFESNIKKNDIIKLFANENFLQNILLSWIDINNHVTKENTSQEIIWNNSELKIGGNTFYYKTWFNRGIKLIEHIYDYRKKDFYNFMDISNLYQIPNADFLKYNALLSCIPNTWKLKLKEETINTKREENNLELILKSKHVNRLLYSIQIKNTKTNEKKSEQKWEEQFQNIKWKIVYTTYIRSTISSKIRNFQYKFLTRILPTNKWLYKCKLVNSSLCDFCNMFTDSINHLFWECQHIQQFWRDLHTFLATKHVYIDFSGDETYNKLSDSRHVWFCLRCNLPNYSSSLVESLDSLSDTNIYSYLENPSNVTQSSCSSVSNSTHDIPMSPRNSSNISNYNSPKATSTPKQKSKSKSKPLNKTKERLVLLNINCRSIKNKIQDLHQVIDQTKPDIIACTETWLKPDVFSSEIFPDELGYVIIRDDRTVGKGGGVLLAVSKRLVCEEQPDLKTDCNICWAKINIKGVKTIYVSSFYKPHENDENSLLYAAPSADELKFTLLSPAER